MTYHIFIYEHAWIYRGSRQSLEEAKAAAMKLTDDALPSNTVHVMADLGFAGESGGGDGPYWHDYATGKEESPADKQCAVCGLKKYGVMLFGGYLMCDECTEKARNFSEERWAEMREKELRNAP